MGKFFFKPSDRAGDFVHFTGSTAHHLIKVLRLSIGQEIQLCDGNNTDFIARLEKVIEKPQMVILALLSSRHSNAELPFGITLYQGLPKSDKLELIIEKCIELGVSKIVPTETTRSIVSLNNAINKIERYKRIAESAAAQSMRGIIPTITHPKSFANAADNSDSNFHIIAYENEKTRTIKATLETISPKPISLWVGPEGGFTESEIDLLTKKGGNLISLGPRILRTETSGMAAIAQITCIWDGTNDIF